MKFTGNIRFRSTWRGKLILQAQIERFIPVHDLFGEGKTGSTWTEWHDARVEDLGQIMAAEVKQ